MSKLTMETLEQRLGALPAMPEAIACTLRLLDDGAGYAELEHSIGQDPALAARVLRLANSAFFGFAGHIASLRDACLILGHQVLRQVVVAVGAMAALPGAEAAPLDQQALWRHALGTASAARLLAVPLRVDPGTAATAGLLHDLGRLLFNTFLPDEYTEVRHYESQHGCTLIEAEGAVIGLDHAEAGAWLVRHWNLPEGLATAVARHHCPDLGEPQPLVDLVHLADIITRRHEIGFSDHGLAPEPARGAWQRIGLDWPEIENSVPEAQMVRDSTLFAAA